MNPSSPGLTKERTVLLPLVGCFGGAADAEEPLHWEAASLHYSVVDVGGDHAVNRECSVGVLHFAVVDFVQSAVAAVELGVITIMMMILD